MGLTPYNYLPFFGRLAIERLDADSGLRTAAQLDILLNAYAQTHGEACDEDTRQSAHRICARRFGDSFTPSTTVFGRCCDRAATKASNSNGPATCAGTLKACAGPIETVSEGGDNMRPVLTAALFAFLAIMTASDFFCWLSQGAAGVCRW